VQVRHRGKTYGAVGSVPVRTEIMPDFQITKTGPSTALARAEITYTLTITNVGGLAAGVLITDRIPADAIWIRGGVLSNGIVTWNIGDLTHTANVIRTFVVTATQTITNSDYAASATGGYRTAGTQSVVTVIDSGLLQHKVMLVSTEHQAMGWPRRRWHVQ